MQLPKIIEVRGMRVLTTKQIAEAYGTEPERIKLNYRYNKKRFVEGKHIIPIEGQELREFKARYQFNTQFKYAKSLYLWTEKGALLHAKSLNTDKAWEVYDYLVDFYFRAKEQEQPKPQTYREIREAALAEKRSKEIQSRPNLMTVVDVPENVKSQRLIENIKKHLTALEILLDGSNRYISKEKFNIYCGAILNVQMQLMNLIPQYTEQPVKLIEKRY